MKQTTPHDARWITIEAAAAHLGWTYHRVRNWVLTGKLRGKVLLPFNRRVVDAADIARVAREQAGAR